MRGDGLRNLYPSEYNAWRNMKSRVKARGQAVHPDFERFESFIEVMGPIPAAGHTLDRIDTYNPEYSPDNCRWASKRDQANNRRNTIRMQFEGRFLPVTEVARLTGKSADTLRRQISRNSARASAQHPDVERDPYLEWRWLGDDTQIRNWQDIYYGKVRDFDGEIGIAYRHESPEDFVLRNSIEAVEAMETGDFSRLPEILSQQLQVRSEAWPELRARFLHLIGLAGASQITRQFADDPLVQGVSCPVDWLDPALPMNELFNSVRRSVRAFDKAGLPLPRRLSILLERYKGQLLLTRHIKAL